MTGKTLYPLISFDMIFNKDIGIIRYIRGRSHPYIFSTQEIHELSDGVILSLVHCRKNRNPLSAISSFGAFSKTSDDLMDEFYNEYMTDYIEYIVNESPFTDFGYTVIAMCSGNFDGIHPCILVHNEYEFKKIKDVKEFNNATIIMANSLDEVNAPYPLNPYYLNSMYELIDLQKNNKEYDYTKFDKKIFYIADYEYNSIAITEFLKNQNSIKYSEYNMISLWRKDTVNYAK